MRYGGASFVWHLLLPLRNSLKTKKPEAAIFFIQAVIPEGFSLSHLISTIMVTNISLESDEVKN